ncbi:MAG: hypothetical protein MJ174_02570 [Treponema sp.]|nr:hypothetical protein [Treponema sp.]
MKVRLIIFAFLLSSIKLFSQNAVPNGYQNIKLGMDLEETKEELVKNPDFGYHGDRDVSLLPGGNKQVLIETDAEFSTSTNFLTRCWFQFYENKLYIITINLNKEKIDYYSMFTTLTDKYGLPTKLDPKKAIWENDEYTMILEKPVSIKYIEKATYNQLLTSANVEKSGFEITKQMFMDEF